MQSFIGGYEHYGVPFPRYFAYSLRHYEVFSILRHYAVPLIHGILDTMQSNPILTITWPLRYILICIH